MYDGMLNVYKEKGYTSHDVVARLRGILHQKLQKRIFRPRQLYRLIQSIRRMRTGIQSNLPVFQCSRDTAGSCISKLNRDPGQKLFHIKWFRYIIRRSAKEQAHLVLHSPFRAHDDHREPQETGQHLLPGQAWQHQIQKHQIRRPPGGQPEKRLRP